MPYSLPAPTPATGRPGHRRSYSSNGAFASLGPLPRRPKASFHLQDDDEEDDSPEDVRINDETDAQLLRLKLKIPFPQVSPTRTQPPRLPSPPASASRPAVARTASTPILLSNGKPLKSSLKGSASSPHIPFPPQSLVPSIMFPQHHQRAASAPSTPNLNFSAPSSPSTPSTPSSPTTPPPTAKTVHFPSQEEGGLATVKLFNRSAKPASVSRVGDDTETETETEGYGSGREASLWPAWNATQPPSFPFPRMPVEERLDIDGTHSSPVPQRGVERAEGFVYVESLGFETSEKQLRMAGTVLVRNITYQKSVAIRFTLDDWQTTHEVQAKHVKSLVRVPEKFAMFASGAGGSSVCPPLSGADIDGKATYMASAPAWDRFRFDIDLEDYRENIEKRTMWLVARYTMGIVQPSGVPTTETQEWWDNNSGMNYRFAFKRTPVPLPAVNAANPKFKRNVVVSAPPSFSPPKPTLAAPQVSSGLSFHLPSAASSTAAQQDQQRQRQEALTRSTLAHLKKLNLRNYAAPSPLSQHATTSNPIPIPVPIHSRTSSTSTSTDSTPVQTPTQDIDEQPYERFGKHDVDVNVLDSQAPDEDSLRPRWKLEGGHVATYFAPSELEPTPPPPQRQSSPPIAIPQATRFSATEMGTSPPFSALSSSMVSLRSAMEPTETPRPRSGVAWPWGSSPSGSPAPKLDGVHDLLKDIKVKSTEVVSFPRKSPSPPPTTTAPVPVPIVRTHSKESSLSSTGSTGSLGQLPTRRRVSGNVGSVVKVGSPGVVSASPPVPSALASPPKSAYVPPPGRVTAHQRVPAHSATLWDEKRGLTEQQVPDRTGNGSPPASDKLYQAFVKQWCFAQGP